MKITEEQVDEYWKGRMAERMEPFWEAIRLFTVLKSHYWSHVLHEEIAVTDTYTFMDFWSSKRPYGNKCVPSSIAFNLGWDKDRVLAYHDIPSFVEEEAMEVHNKVLDLLEDDWDNHLSYKKYLSELRNAKTRD